MARSARFGRPNGSGNVSLRFEANSLIRLVNKNNQFFGGPFQKALEEVHERAAIQVQQGMADRLEREVKSRNRPQRPSAGRLAAALKDEKNRSTTASGFAVLIESWMKRSPAALYWRRIEEGDRATFTARVLFTNNMSLAGPYSRPGQGRQVRMPQFKTRGLLVQVGPYADYRYTRGGTAALRKIDFYNAYRTQLRKSGFDLDQLVRARQL